MSEATTIDTLEVKIVSNSTGAAQGIEELARSLGKLKENGSIGVACKNLERLSEALRQLNTVSSETHKLRSLAKAMSELAGVGSISKVVNQLTKLPGALSGLSKVDVDTNLSAKLSGLAQAVEPLSKIKSGGFGTMVNALGKIADVTKKLDDETIKKFADRIKELNKVLEPLSAKMTTIQAGLRGVNSAVKSAGNSMKTFGTKVNAARLNLASLVTVVQGAISVLMPLVRLFSSTISEAIEWEGIAARFGRGFGDQAEEVYAWVQRLNREMGINIQQFMQYSSVFATMLTGFGVNERDSAKMALGYTELVYDIWAGYNDVYKNFADAADAVKSAIAGEVEPIRRAGFTIVESTLEQTAANHGLEISLENATEAQKSYLRYLTLVDQAHAQNLVGAYARELNTAEGLMRTFAQQLKSLAQAFGSLFLPILVKVMPWLQAFVSLLTDAIYKVAAFFGIDIQPATWGDATSSLGGIADSANTATDSLDDTADAVDKTTDALKDLKKATIGIDELNVISPPTQSSGAGGAGGSGSGAGIGGGLGAFDGLGIDSLWDESIFDQIQFEVDKIKSILKEALTSITAVIAGFMLAIGTILVVSGANIPVGLALMAVGAVTLVGVIAQNWNGMSEQLAKTLTLVTSVLGGFLLAVGAILAFSGVNVPLGITLMAIGAVSLATAATINWKFLEGDLKNALSMLTAIVAGSLLAIGALFAITGVDVPLGIALMVAGAIGLATAVGLNWDSLSAPMRTAIGTLEAIVGGALLTWGAVLALTGVNIPMGIAMIAAGAISLVSAAALNWNALSGDMKTAVATITSILSGALLGIGGILAFSGVNLPLGIALIAAGAIGLVASAPVNWSGLTEKIETVSREIGMAVGGSLLALGAVLAFSGVASGIGFALLGAGAGMLTASTPLNWDSTLSPLESTLQKIMTIASGAMLAIGLLLVASGVSFPVGLAAIAVGAIGLVSSVTMNWNLIVESVKNTLQKFGIIAGASLLALGLILCLSGVGIPLGIGLIAAGAVGLASGVALNWDAITDKVGQTIDNIGEEWDRLYDETMGPIEDWFDGVIEWFTDLWDELVGHSIVPDTIDGIVECFRGLPGKTLGLVSGFVTSIIDKFKDFGSKIVEKVKSGWNTVKSWWNGNSGLEKTEVAVSLVKSGWTTVKAWIGSIPGISQAISLVKSGWSSIKSWIGSTSVISQAIKLVKSGWTSITSWIGSISTISQAIKLVKSGWSSVKKWIGNIPVLTQAMKLAKSGWSSVKGWVGTIPVLSIPMKLVKNGWTTVKNWLGNLNFNIGFKLPRIGINWGRTTVMGFTISYPQSFFTYAKGGFPDFGELFIAREAGPEMVGKIGSKTTVANNDQIVEAVSEGVYTAVLAAMQASESGSGQSVNVYLDGRQLTAAVEKRQHERGATVTNRLAYSY